MTQETKTQTLFARLVRDLVLGFRTSRVSVIVYLLTYYVCDMARLMMLSERLTCTGVATTNVAPSEYMSGALKCGIQ
jgi:hypothetical protein